MGTLTTLREGLVATLREAGITALGYEPERITPPVAIVSHGEPYLTEPTEGRTYAPGTYVLRLQVRLVLPVATAEVLTPELDEQIEAVHAATADTWDLTEVTSPFTLIANGVNYAATDLTLTDLITL